MNDFCVHVVDDDEAMCEALEYLLKSDGLRTATYGSARQFLNAYDPRRPGVLVLDVRMHGMDGLELQKYLVNKGYDIPVIILTGHGDVPMAVKAVRAGALEFLQKPVDDQPLFDSIRRAAKIDAANRLRRERMRSIETRIHELTKRETEVMELVVNGLANKQIAEKLSISSKTVEVHRKHVMQKMAATSTVDLTCMVLWFRNQQALILGA